MKASTTAMLHHVVLLVALLAAQTGLAPRALAEEADRTMLRERIRERIEKRRAAAPIAEEGKDAGRPLAPGTHTLHLSHQGRRALLHIPPGYDASKPAPLVFAFHGGGGNAEYMADDERYGLVGKADREGFVVVFPNGTSKRPNGRFATWNAGGCCGDARDLDVDDVGFVRALLERVKAQVSIDPSRVFATGMSNGGMLSYRLACEAPDVFRAIASVAGTDGTLSCSPARPVSVLHIHARNDTHVLFDGGAGPNAFRDGAKVMDFVSVPETVARWVKHDRCAPAPRRVVEKPGATCEAYADCSAGVSVRLCVTDDGGHSWPGARTVRRGKEAASQALDATDVIWRFFEASAAR